MPNCERNCGECARCVGTWAQAVIDEKYAENAKLRAEVERLTQQTKDEATAYSSLAKSHEDMKLQNDQALQAMNDVYSLLSLVRHRHLPKGLGLEVDMDKALCAADKFMNPWWKRQREQQENRNDDCTHPPTYRLFPENLCQKCGQLQS